MPRTIESIVESHRAATELRKAGRPIWTYKVILKDIFHNDDLTFEQRRDAIVRRLRKSPWAKDNYTLSEYLDELADAEDADDFDYVWDAIYDEADRDRVWIATF
jgi:hypothetical protein